MNANTNFLIERFEEFCIRMERLKQRGENIFSPQLMAGVNMAVFANREFANRVSVLRMMARSHGRVTGGLAIDTMEFDAKIELLMELQTPIGMAAHQACLDNE